MRTARRQIRPRRAVAAIAAASACALLLWAPAASARDRKPPRITGAVTKDTDGDGKVDALRVRYSEKVALLAGKGSMRLRASGYSVASRRLASTVTRLATAKRCYPGRSIRRLSRVVLLKLAEKATPDTAATPDAVYTRTAKSRRKVVDGSCNEAYTGVFRSTRDGAPPRAVSAATADDDADGRLDAMRVTFSEPVSHPGASGPGKVSVAGMTVSGIDAADAAQTLHVKLGEGGSADSGNHPAVTYNPAAAGAAVTDAAGNAAGGPNTLSPSDGAPPVLLAAVTADLSGAAGSIDRIVLSYSEPVIHPADSDGTYPLSVNGYSVASVGAASGVNIAVNLTEGPADSGATPAVGYGSGPGAAVVDAGGNQPRTGAFSGTTDGAAPVLLSARTADGDANGKIDAVKLSFSEGLTYAGQSGGGPFTVGGRTITSTDPTSSSTLTLNLSENPSFDTDATPSLDYAPGTGALVKDGAALVAPAKSFAQVGDGAEPAIVAAPTADGNGNGRLDGVALTFSEPVVHADQTSGPFPLRVQGHGVSEVGAVSGAGNDRVDLTLDEGSFDTGDRPPVTYTGDGASQIKDVANNTPSSGAVVTTDGAAPVLVGGTTVDGGPVNGRMDAVTTQWSEAIDHGADSDGSYPLSVTNPNRSIPGGGIPDVNAASQFDLPLSEGPSADRDKSPTLSYAPTADHPVHDGAGNEALAGSVTSDPACADPHEGNASDDDTEAQATPLGPTQRPERLCGGDEDWFSLSAGIGDTLKVLVHPAQSIDPRLELYNSLGNLVGSTVNVGGLGIDELLTLPVPGAGTYSVRVFDTGFADGNYCIAGTVGLAPPDPQCGLGPGDVLITEVMADPGSSGLPDFVELYNRSGSPQNLAGLKIDYGGASPCTIAGVSGPDVNVPDGGRVWGADSAAGRDFTCAGLSVPNGGADVKLLDKSTIVDDANLAGVAAHPGHSLETKPSAESSEQGNNLASAWCYTFFNAQTGQSNAAATRGQANDGCDEFRVNEAYWNAPGSDEGKTFVELAGNATPVAEPLLAGWRLAYVKTDDPSAGSVVTDNVLPAGADPGSDGVYVVADSKPDGTSTVNPHDVLFTDADPQDVDEGIQLLRPGTPSSSPNCGGDTYLADVFSHVLLAPSVSRDGARSCFTQEGTLFNDPGSGPGASRTNGADTGSNSADFHLDSGTGTPGQL